MNKVIQYTIDPTYEHKETMQVVGLLVKVLLLTLKKIKEAGHTFHPEDLLFYPANSFEIGRTKKLFLTAKENSKGILEYVDDKFMKELEKIDLKVFREEF